MHIAFAGEICVKAFVFNILNDSMSFYDNAIIYKTSKNIQKVGLDERDGEEIGLRIEYQLFHLY